MVACFLAKLIHRMRTMEEAMGAFNLTNLLGSDVKIVKCEVNKEPINVMSGNIRYPYTLMTAYNGKKWDEFSGFILEIEFNGAKYHVDLNKDHYFYGDKYQYPGDGSDVDFILFGTNTAGRQVQLRLAYCKSNDAYLTASNDYKYMDKT